MARLKLAAITIQFGWSVASDNVCDEWHKKCAQGKLSCFTSTFFYANKSHTQSHILMEFAMKDGLR